MTDWDEVNVRRVALIRKELRSGLTPCEKIELYNLEKAMDRHVRETCPTGFAALDEIRKRARKAGIRLP